MSGGAGVPVPQGALAGALQQLEWGEIQRMASERAATVLGRRQADLLAPSLEAEEVHRERRLTVECRGLQEGAGRLPFHALQDPDPILARLRVEGVRLDPQEVYELCLVLRNAEELRAAIPAGPGSGTPFPLLRQLVGSLADLGPLLREAGDHISPTGQVLDSASPELRRIRRRITHLSERLQRELEAIAQRADSGVFLRDEYVTVRNGRFVLPIRTDSPIPVPGVLHGRSSTGLTHFIEPMATVEINNELVALREAEEEEIDRVLRRYTRLLQERLGEIEGAAAMVGRLDGIQARARLGVDLGGIAASDAEDGQVVLHRARHPLLQESLAPRGEEPVPISLELGGNYPVLIISGPNTGGKTVALKTLGLLALMNQAGLLVPAEAARIPVFRRILVDIGDHQSIAASLSTFSSHMRNIAAMTGDLEAPALVLLDEIGTGTDPDEGAALGTAILRHFHRSGALVAVTTHMSGIKSYGYTTPGVKNACVEFDERTLRPTFRLLLGVAGSSSGIEIARRLGLPEPIVEDARGHLGPESRDMDAYLRRVKQTLDEVAQERERLAGEVRDLERQRERLESEARRREEGRERLFREEMAAALQRYERALHEHLRGVDDKAIRLRLERDGRRRGERVGGAMEREARRRFAGGQPVPAPPAEVRPGDRVRVVSLGLVGRVAEVGEERIRVEVSGKVVSVPLAELALVERATPAGPAPLPRGVSLQPAEKAPVGAELNLVGRTVDEALPLVDKFLDDAYLAGHPWVNLIHGHGTGTLRRAVAAFLKEHPHVANYRLGAEGEGGTGVTVVELRR